MRNVKTALAATLCAMIYLLFGRNPTFACIGAVFGMGYDMGNSWLSGGNRLFGTIIGGLLGMGLFSLYIIFVPEGGLHPLILPLLFLGVLVLIAISLTVKWPGAIQPGAVMLCILLFNQPVDSYIAYSLNRIVDTAIGVVIALGVNLLLPRERLVRWLVKLHLHPEEPAPKN
ncbi:MAG: FUSC family protein [Clostridiales bacterium]|nr:FUSC family protein [Clostridiales bacterium]